MGTVTNTILNPAGQPIVGATVSVALVTADGPGYTGTATVESVATTVSDATGTWSLTLPDNATYSPANTYYQVTEAPAYPRQSYVSNIVVPSGAGPFQLSALLVGTPAAPAQQYIAATEKGAAGGVATLDGTGNVPLAQLGNAPSGGGGTPSGTVVAETSYGQASSAGAASAYSRGDHTHGSPALASTAPTASAVGDAAAVGTGATPARADHTHGREAAGTAGASAVGDTASAGAAATIARSDHRHAREAFGAVTAQTAFGAASADGTATTVAHSDHTHGTPAAPTPASIGAVATSAVAAASGVASLDALGQVPGTQLANIAGGATVVRPSGLQLLDKVFYGQAGHPFTFSGTGTTGSNADTSDFVLGAEAVKVTTNGAGAQGKISGTFAAAVDLTAKCLVVWIKMENYSAWLGGYPRFYLGDTGLTNAYYWKLTETAAQPLALDGEWMRLTLPFGAATVVGSPSRASLAALTIQCFDSNAAQSVTLHLGGIATMPEPTQWPNGVVTLSFDDGYLSQFQTAKPYMDKYGFAGTAFVICETLFNHGAYPGYFDLTQAHTLEEQSGWELASHAYTAANHNAGFPSIGQAASLEDMAQARDYLRRQGFRSPDVFSYPLGLFDAGTVANAKALFTAGRTISQLGGFPDESFPPGDLWRVRSQSLGSTNTLASAQAMVDRAFANKQWLVFTFHDIVTTATTNLQWSTANFQALMDYIAAKGIPVRRFSDVLRAAAAEQFGSVVAQSSYGAASTDGAAVTVSRSDHAHGTPALASTAPTTSAVGDAAAAGTGTTPARADHVHGREAFGTVTAQTAFGAASGNGSATTLARSDHTHGTPGAPESGVAFLTPADSGLIAATQPINTVQQTIGVVSGVLYVAKVPLRQAHTLSTLWFATSTAASGLTAGQCFMGIYTPDGVLQASTADLSGSIAASGNYSFPLVTPYAAAAGWVWVAFLLNGTTMPQVRTGGSAPSANLGLTPATYNYGRAATGQTSLPASITPASIANPASGETLWMGVS